MPFEALESKRIHQRAKQFADEVWDLVCNWDWFAKKAFGSQFVRAADSIGANIAEAGRRFHPADVKNFLYHARGSLRESKYWARRALNRMLLVDELFQRLDNELEQLSMELNQLIRHQKDRQSGSN